MKAPSTAELQDIKEELESWVIYGPRAKLLLDQLKTLKVTSNFSELPRIVERYVHHPQELVAQQARGILEEWKDVRSVKRALEFPGSDDDSDVPSRVRRKEKERKVEKDEDEESVEFLKAPAGWSMKQAFVQFRGRRERFWNFTLPRPFGNSSWFLQVRVAETSLSEKKNQSKRSKGSKEKSQKSKSSSSSGTLELSEIQELLQRMSLDLGALPSEDALGEEKLRALQRLQRLEQRFTGPGVTEAEARNALRLFERELSKANWTEEKFAKLKRQLAGTEEWSAADVVVECSLKWVQEGKRRQAWFTNVSERMATPLGIEFGYTSNGGCCFVGPLSAALGAGLTTALVCHLAHLDLKKHMEKTKRISAPQFLQGFVDGALAKERHLVWEKLFEIENGEDAKRFCEEHLRQGFFDDGDAVDSEELRSMLESMFTAAGAVPGPSGPSGPTGPSGPGVGHVRAGQVGSSEPAQPFAPFSGKAHRLDEEEPREEKKSWALTFASNLEVARLSRTRSREEAKRTFHWTFSGQAVKETKTDTTSYTKGRNAGEKRKHQIERASGTAKTKFRKGAPLAITR